MRAASTISSGIDLMAGDSTTMAKPVCIQIMITISKRLFHGLRGQPRDRVLHQAELDPVEEADVAEAFGPEVVDQPPGHRGPTNEMAMGRKISDLAIASPRRSRSAGWRR